MPKQALKENLENLRAALGGAGELDSETRRDLAAIAAQIEQLLQEADPDYRAAHADLETQALRFEASHPAFSRILSEVTDALAKLGI